MPRTQSLIESEAQPETIEKLYQRILMKSGNKGCGKFQWLMVVVIMCGLSGFGYIEYGLGFLELFPQFDCTIDGVEKSDCST